jgi:hypothetical protein
MDDERLEAIDFHGMELWASVQGETDAEVWVPVAPICQYLEFSTWGQQVVIKKSPTFDGRYQVIAVPSRGGVQETLALRLDMVNLWLAGISPRRIKDPVKRDRLVLYQRECAQVLYQHFFTTPRGRSVQIETQLPIVVLGMDELRQEVRTGFAQLDSKIEATTFRTQDSVASVTEEIKTELHEQFSSTHQLLADQRATMDQVASDVEDARPQLRFLTEATSAVRERRQREPTPGQRHGLRAYLRQLELFGHKRRRQ